MKQRWPMVLAAVVAGLVGIASGVGAYTFIYAKGASYLTNDPTACANCHIMDNHYNAWRKGSHRAVAVCNDCHTPHNFFGKYYIKGMNGWHHSVAFTSLGLQGSAIEKLGVDMPLFHEPIRMGERNRRVTEQACRYCHQDIVAQIDHGGKAAAPSGSPSTTAGQSALEQISCIRCHEDVGHME